MLVRKNKYVGLQQNNPMKELMLFWPHECPDSQVGMDKPPKMVFQLLDDTKTRMLVRKNKYVGLQQKIPTKELMLFWPHECPNSQVGMDKPPIDWFFNSWMTPKP